jgi:hypothetical protein
MNQAALRGQKSAPTLFRELVRHYQWIHLCLGLTGNTAFVIGSVLFLWGATERIAIWLFIIGSCGMFIGALGSAIVKYDESKQKNANARDSG